MNKWYMEMEERLRRRMVVGGTSLSVKEKKKKV